MHIVYATAEIPLIPTFGALPLRHIRVVPPCGVFLLDAESSALTAIVLSGSTAYDDEGAIGTNDTTSAILKITRKAISEMRVLFFTETTSNRRKMLHQTCAIVWMEVNRIAP